MAGPTDQEVYDAMVQLYAPPSSPTYPKQQTLDHWRPHLPQPLLRWWREQGWGGLNRGMYWLCDPDLLRPVIEEIFTGDPEFDPADLIPFGYNSLGVVDVYFGQGRTMTIDLPFGTVTWRDQSINTATNQQNSDFRVIFRRIRSGADRLDLNDENDRPIFPWALENLGGLGPGEIYGFVPAYAISQRYPVENLQKLPVVEHLVFLASIQRPTLYDYEMPKNGQPGFGTLIPRRLTGPQG